MKYITLVIILCSFIIAIYSYQTINSDLIASHWDAQGKVNGYTSKFWGLFLMPIISLGIYLLLMFLPRIDPLKKNIVKFRLHYDRFILVLMIYLFYVFLLTITFNYGYNFNLTRMLIPAIGLLFIYLGTIMTELKRNWFMGIRTPWTLSSDKVWNKTHHLGSKLFKISGIIVLLGLFFESYLVWFILVPLLITVVWLTFYSYLEYKKIIKK